MLNIREDQCNTQKDGFTVSDSTLHTHIHLDQSAKLATNIKNDNWITAS